MSGPENGDGWRRLHPVTPLLRSVQLLYAFIFGALAAQFGGPVLLVLLASLAALAAWLTAGYLRFRYKVTDESLIIHHGVLFRQRRVIPRSRIQNVDLRAGLAQQALQVVTARIETAGGQGTEALLHVVSRAEGARLRDDLVALPSSADRPITATAPARVDGPPRELFDGITLSSTASQASPIPEVTVHRTSLLDLVIAGATSNRAGLLVAGLLGGDYLLDFMPTDWLVQRFVSPELVEAEAAVNSLLQSARHDVGMFILGVFALVLFFALAGWGLSVFLSVVRYFDFTLTQTGGELRVNYGLLTRREKGFRRSRVQNIQIEESILRRWLGLASLQVQTAGYGPGVKSEDRMEALTPIARSVEVGGYLQAIYPDFEWSDVQWRRSHPRARQRFFIRRALVIALAASLTATFVDPAGLILLVALIPAWLLASAHYRHLGHARLGPYVLVREGFWTRRTYVVPVRKIQALHVRESPFQRRLGLGTVSVETAGNPLDWHAPRSVDVGRAYGIELMDSLAYEVTGTGLTF